MTAFVLVSGPFTGGWIWRETADRLRGSGAEAHPLTLTGLGERRHLAGPGTDLETHIEDVVQLIDHLDAPELVLVGHDYAIHPVLGAADRRPERISRVVHLDAGLPQDGDAALALVPDQEVRERLMRPDEYGRTELADPRAAARRVAALGQHRRPPGGGAGPVGPLRRAAAVRHPRPAAAAHRGARRTAHHRRPLHRRRGDHRHGRDAGSSGPPQFRALADPRASFFELATGHWPMLSDPDELAIVLLRAAAA